MIIISIAIIIVNKPYFLNFDKIDANPKNMNERGVKVKNIIETYKCIFPEVSGNIPIKDNDIAANKNKNIPILFNKPLKKLYKLKLNKIKKNPDKINPELNIIAEGSLAPKSLKALLIQENQLLDMIIENIIEE